MLSVDTPIQLLDKHAGLACRLIRTQGRWHAYLRWLEQPSADSPLPPSPATAILGSLETLFQPLRDEVSGSVRNEIAGAGHWFASICDHLVERSSRLSNETVIRLVAVGLLPLYRSLATGKVREGFVQSRRRFSDAIVLASLVDCLGVDIGFGRGCSATVSPHSALNQVVGVDFNRLVYLVEACLPGYDPDAESFDSDSRQLLSSCVANTQLPSRYDIPVWANPQILWVIANEMISGKPDIILPHSWVDTPVPWNKIARHWLSLEQQLSGNPVGIQGTQNSECLDSEVDSRRSQTGGIKPQLSDVPLRGAHPGDNRGKAQSLFSGHTDVSKIRIGEIKSFQDPGFVNLIKHQVSVCRAGSRSMCVSMIVVLTDKSCDAASLAESHENGLISWQQKLVNWLSEDSGLTEPHAFVTHDGQLVLSVIDLERNELTAILREGLVEILTGSRGVSGGDLGLVKLPAKFHVGIAATTAPSASFDANELIASADRCLAVARRVGSNSIKSIEVF